MRVAVVGAGSWGTAVATLLQRKAEHEILLWARRAELAETINLFHENPLYLPDIALPEGLAATSNLRDAIAGAEVIVMAVPSHGFRSVLRSVLEHVSGRPTFVSLTKGLEVTTRKRMSEVLSDEVEGITARSIAVLTGPNLAREIATGFPAASTVACADDAGAALIHDLFHTTNFRCYSNNDVAGAEIGGAFKNVIAIAAGIAEGLGYGDNTKATVITRGLAEMARFSVHFGAQPITFLGLAGVGDLIATCASPQSRNHSVGIELGKGRDIGDIMGSMKMVAEGVQSCKPILELGTEAGVWMPITENVVAICHEGASVEGAVADLLARELRSEFHGVENYLLVHPKS